MATKTVKDVLVETIKNRIVDIPDSMTTEELVCYLKGYAKCQEDILRLIENFSLPQP